MIGGKDGENSLKLEILIQVFDYEKLTRFNFLFIPLPVKTTDRSFFTYAVLLQIFPIWKNSPFFIIINFIDCMSAHGLGRVLRRSQTAQIRTTSQYHSRPTPHHLPIKIGLKLFLNKFLLFDVQILNKKLPFFVHLSPSCRTTVQ